MILIRNLNQINHQLPKTILTIGNFDGVHIAHQTIIQRTIDEARARNLKSAILTFEPHPVKFFNANRPDFNQHFRIYNLATKIKIIKNLHPDFLIIIPFNQNFSNISANTFIDEILINKLNVQGLIIGHDFNFGKNRQGDVKLLTKYHFNIQQIGPDKILNDQNQEIIISSSLARQSLQDGKIEFLNQILGRNYAIRGSVIEGQKLARTIGFRTANIKVKNDIIYPKFGVYKTRTFINKYHKFFDSITNFGIKPTLDKNHVEPIFETHLINFDQEIYHHNIDVEFIKFIREERKFSSLSELKQQITIDLQAL